MNDLISRQAAIEAIHREGSPFLEYAAWKIEALPVIEIIHCKDCKYYKFADNRAFGFPVKRCEWTGFEDVDEEDFCSRAERKSDG